jgi:DNA-binding response OmpR family regulator
MSKTGMKILVVDDDPRYLELLEFSLMGEGYDVVIVQDPQTVQELAIMQKPAVIVTDVSMPNMDGYAMAMGLKADQATASIPLIFVSARGQEIDRLAGLSLGAVEYLTKPFCISELIARIRLVLKRTAAEGVLP